MKTENWNGHEIRFVEKDGEWWAAVPNIAGTLKLKTRELNRRLKDGGF